MSWNTINRLSVAGFCVTCCLINSSFAHAAKDAEKEREAIAFFGIHDSIALKKDQRAQVLSLYTDMLPRLQIAQQKMLAAKEKEHQYSLTKKVSRRNKRNYKVPTDVQKGIDTAAKEYHSLAAEANSRIFNMLDDRQKQIINPDYDPKQAGWGSNMPAAAGATKNLSSSDAADQKKKP